MLSSQSEAVETIKVYALGRHYFPSDPVLANADYFRAHGVPKEKIIVYPHAVDNAFFPAIVKRPRRLPMVSVTATAKAAASLLRALRVGAC